MNRTIKLVTTTVCILFLLSGSVKAESGKSVNRVNSKWYLNPLGSRHGLIIPEQFKEDYHKNARWEIQKKNLRESLGRSDEVKYNQNGTIAMRVDNDGNKINYSYEYDKSGRMVSTILKSDEVTMMFTKAGPEDPQLLKRNYKSAPPDLKPAEAGHSEPKPVPDADTKPSISLPADKSGKPVIIYYSLEEETLNKVSTTPLEFDFREIENTIQKLQDGRKIAYAEYMKDTEAYYKELYVALKENFDLLKSEIDLSRFFEGFLQEDSSEAKKREFVDEVVAQIHSEADKANISAEPMEEFLAFERELASEILVPNKKIYDRKIERILAGVTATIDNLVNSRLAVYLNLNPENDMIDALINLKEPEE